MTDIEQKALALVNEVAVKFHTPAWHTIDRRSFLEDVICRAIEQHEAFRQEVSDAVQAAQRVYGGHREAFDRLDRFIIPKPVDPLVEALEEWINSRELDDAAAFRDILDRRGLEIREKAGD